MKDVFLKPRPHWEIPEDMSNVIPLSVMAKNMHLHPRTLQERAKKGKVRCFKIRCRWYCQK